MNHSYKKKYLKYKKKYLNQKNKLLFGGTNPEDDPKPTAPQQPPPQPSDALEPAPQQPAPQPLDPLENMLAKLKLRAEKIALEQEAPLPNFSNIQPTDPGIKKPTPTRPTPTRPNPTPIKKTITKSKKK